MQAGFGIRILVAVGVEIFNSYSSGGQNLPVGVELETVLAVGIELGSTFEL